MDVCHKSISECCRLLLISADKETLHTEVLLSRFLPFLGLITVIICGLFVVPNGHLNMFIIFHARLNTSAIDIMPNVFKLSYEVRIQAANSKTAFGFLWMIPPFEDLYILLTKCVK